VISIYLPATGNSAQPKSIFQVVNRCFQIQQGRAADKWRNETDLVVTPDVVGIAWDAFGHGPRFIEAGQIAASTVVPTIQQWFSHTLCAKAIGHWCRLLA
jgi:hypothetical protein